MLAYGDDRGTYRLDGRRKVFHVELQGLDFLRELVPFVVLDHCQVNVDQLAGKARELIVHADGIVAASGLLIAVLRAGLPLVRMHDLSIGMPDCKSSHSVATTDHLKSRQVGLSPSQ